MVPTRPMLSSRKCPLSSGCFAGGGDLALDTPVMLPNPAPPAQQAQGGWGSTSLSSALQEKGFGCGGSCLESFFIASLVTSGSVS